MRVEINNQNTVSLPLMGHIIIGNDEACDIVLECETESTTKVCSIIYDKFLCILEIFNQHTVYINSLPIEQRAIIHPGDKIHIYNNILTLINENALPKTSSNSFKLLEAKDLDKHLITSVSGLRNFNPGFYGELAVIGSQNSYTHKTINEEDISFSVSYIDDHLTLLCQKDKHIYINGNRAEYVQLKNGDYIDTGVAKYCVESPGTSSFSKYSPSHPRNIQLSEEYFVDINDSQKDRTGFWSNNSWWILLLAGLFVLAIVLYIIKNN